MERNKPWENQEPKVVGKTITNEAIRKANDQGRKITAEELGLKDDGLTEEERENLDKNNI